MENKQVKRTERGWPGHFICADMCQFRRNTLLEYGDKKWVISTVGRMIVTNPQTKKREFSTIGVNRYYETMAFEAKEVENGYIDADVSKTIEFDSRWAIADIQANSEQRANDMHEAVVEELSLKIKEQDDE